MLLSGFHYFQISDWLQYDGGLPEAGRLICKAGSRPLNAISEESTGWYEPSTRVALRKTTGLAGPKNSPVDGVAKAFFTAGKKFLGTLPPKTLSAKTRSSFSAWGSNSIPNVAELAVTAGLLLVFFGGPAP
jgi:hypothetical protein